MHRKRAASCACGFKDNNGRLWRESVTSDFTPNGGALAAVEANWSIQDWLKAANADEGSPLPRLNLVDNVFQDQAALALKTSKDDGSGTTKVAEIDSKRDDIQFGTFRIRAKVPDVPGVCFGFFTYREQGSKVNEQDIEILTADPDFRQRVHYTNQPGTVNGEEDPDAYKSLLVDGADFTKFGEHRFDWIPGQTHFFFDGKPTHNLTKNVPDVGSSILVNLWSDGGVWTRGPPKEDAVALVQNIKMFFNSTSLDGAKFDSQCAAAGNVDPCEI